MLKVGARVVVEIDEFIGEACEQINLQAGTIIGVDDWLFPYTIELDNKELNKLISVDSPRRFSKSELKLR